MGSNVVFSANASSTNGIAFVAFAVDGMATNSNLIVSNFPYTATAQPKHVGSYTIAAIAMDDSSDKLRLPLSSMSLSTILEPA